MVKPTELTCAPGASHSRRSTGSVAGVATQTTPAPSRAACGDAEAIAPCALGQRPRGLGAAAPDADLGPLALARQGAQVRLALHAGADHGQHVVPRTSSRVASREPAAVRAAVIASPSISAAGVPVAASKTTIAAWWAGSWPG